MPISIGDVAERANVSSSTVSRILNSDAQTKYAPKTQELVRRIAREMGYRPNAIARSLRLQRTNIIGLYVEYGFINTRFPVFAELFTGLESGCLLAKQDLLLHGNLGHESADAAFAEITNGKVDGLVLNTVPDDRLVELLTAARFPMVTLIDRIPPLPYVVADVVSGCRLLTEHLAGEGHRKVLYRIPPGATENIRTRALAFQEEARALGIDVTTSVTLEWSGELSDEELEMLKQSGPDRHTAVVGCTDEFAYPVCDACDDLGLRIPEDIAVAGYNGVLPRMRPVHRLTTIRAPWHDIAAQAVKLLMSIIDGETVARETLLPVELIIGDTT